MPSPVGALAMLQKAIHSAKEYQKIRDLITPLTRPHSPLSMDARIMSNEMMFNSEATPEALTTIFHDQASIPKAAYQLSPREDSTYLPYLVSYEKGMGSPALEDAFHSAPKKPVYLYATPESVDFYRKQPGWVESIEDGISKFTRKE